ncbi:MAG: von Willebrand factor type A domain-containing protein [Flavobacteriales bacterium]|nr:von Willebrand factor type A domain-containing protein [Flavobacteriales bacterium]
MAASVIMIAAVTWIISLQFFKDSATLNNQAMVLPGENGGESTEIPLANDALQENRHADSSCIEEVVGAIVDTSMGIVLVDSIEADSLVVVLGDIQLSFSNSPVITNGATSPYLYNWQDGNGNKAGTLGLTGGTYISSNHLTQSEWDLDMDGYSSKGKRQGAQKYHYENGQLMIQGNWSSGKESGIITEWSEDGSRKSNENFKGAVGDYSPETYEGIVENEFKDAFKIPLSTFSIDVDAASYSNVRRYINDHQKPPANAVKVEEMINYFQYDYPQPPEEGAHPFSINTEIGVCPWNKAHHLVQIGLQGRKVHKEDLPNSNLVFLIDVSGSMNSSDKLELLKNAFKLLVREVRENDMVSIVVYAGAAGVVLEPTSGANKDRILDALMNLQSGGSTAGGEGIELAYKMAEENLMKNGNNRVILATDGDFNVGLSDDDGLVKLIEEKRKSGIFLTVLGFGRGNYQDAKMEKLADNGNGNHAYIDGLMEAQKVFVNEMGATLLTIAKDVKIQVEFNPAEVKAYRLVGYENRLLANRDFANDAKDAGEMGAGHSVTALYEIILADGSKDGIPLKYQKTTPIQPGEYKDEMMTVKLRYKEPNGSKSKLITHVIKGGDYDQPSNEFQFASSVAEFAMLLRGSKFKGTANYESILERAIGSKGGDEFGYRAEFIKLVKTASIRNYHN